MNVCVFLICFLIVCNKGFAGKDDPTSPSQQSETSDNNGTGGSALGSSEHDQDIQSQRELLRGMGIQNGTDVSGTNMAPDVSVNNGNVTGSNQTSPRLPHQVSDSERPVEARENLGANRASIYPYHRQPRYPQYSWETNRHGTFRGWPKEKTQRPAGLARAGFFYAGASDKVRCFCCGGGLGNWKPGDDPWVEHARWFPNCEFVRQNKGTSFIHQHGLSERQIHQPTSGQSMNKEQGINESSINHQLRDRPLFSRERSSLASLSRWPHDLARTGLFHTGQYPVDDREVRARMDTPIVQMIINMGYPYKTVWAVIENRLRKTGDDFPDASSLLAAIFAFIDAEETIMNESQLRKRPTTATDDGKDKKKISNKEKSSKDACQQADPQHDSTSIREENQRLKDKMMCKICMDEEANVVLLPCAHLGCCSQCAPKVKKCPVCETVVRGFVRAYLS